MSRRHEPLPDELPTQQLELIDPRRGPRVLRLLVSGAEIVRQYGPRAGPWQTKRERCDDPSAAFTRASVQVTRLLRRGYRAVGRSPELEAAIAAAPDDPAPYLVYADWLNARGNPIGEYINVAVARDDQPGNAALAARERELLWANALGLNRPCWGFARWRFGFIEGIETHLNPQQWRPGPGGEGSYRLPAIAEYRSMNGRTSEYLSGDQITQRLNSVRRYPTGAFVRRVYTPTGVYAAREVEVEVDGIVRGVARPGPRMTWELQAID